MDETYRRMIEATYPACGEFLDDEAWTSLQRTRDNVMDVGAFPKSLSRLVRELALPAFLPELARLEFALHTVSSVDVEASRPACALVVNPALALLRLSWSNLASLLRLNVDGTDVFPENREEFVLVWRHPENGRITARPAHDEDLMALKLAAEQIPSREAASRAGVAVYVVDALLDHAVKRGLLLAPPSSIRRDPSNFPVLPLTGTTEEDFSSCSVFTLQWHITQACDLHCRDCRERDGRPELELSQAVGILDDFYEFCRNRGVRGQVSFTGGNPFLHPRFVELYRAAAERDFILAILGNPVERRRIEELVAIERPIYYQVRMEGLRERNDSVCGIGHFDNVLEFLEILRDLDIYSMVMLTLTRDNMGDILPLAELLRGGADLFTFMRLSRSEDGPNPDLPALEDFAAFLEAFADASEDNPTISFKDSLLNIVRRKRGLSLFGGCSGYGCGAAFNSIAVLADGETHACRNFPSRIGNVARDGIAAVYDSREARRYREGSGACRSCALRPACGGCLAVSHSFGLDIFRERDPFCFLDD